MTIPASLPDNDSHPRRVNIIYLGGSVQTLLPFLKSLIDLTELPLRLVANACDNREEQILSDICENSPQLEFYSLKSVDRIEHGKVLDHLLSIEQSDLFCFMDSDIFAAGPVTLSDIAPPSGEAAITSCLPGWCLEADTIMPESYNVMEGAYTKSANGHFLGCSYLAAYRTEPLRKLVEEESLSFQPYQRKVLPEGVLSILSELGFRQHSFDTAKVINLMLQHRGHKMSYQPIDGLIHLGGANRLVRENEQWYKNTLRSIVPQSLLNNIRRIRFNYTKPESEDRADFFLRQSEFWELLEELSNGPPFAEPTMKMISKHSYLQKICEQFATYGNGDGRWSQ
ncbi:MAG: hypothetical protein HKN25_08765 [Pyrinomonadaceae bacterium]|nr:hypothetical protein [Pyrinomonadaceae bacterium]